jgi:hypothetical protein
MQKKYTDGDRSKRQRQEKKPRQIANNEDKRKRLRQESRLDSILIDGKLIPSPPDALKSREITRRTICFRELLLEVSGLRSFVQLIDMSDDD